MSQFVSRVLVTIAGVPLVLGFVYLGGWWLFGLAAVAALIALHELYGMARALRPLVLAGYAGALATLLGAQLGGAEWMVGGFMLTLVLSFLLYGIAETRQTATVTMSTTILGTAWIALGLGHLLLLRDFPEFGRIAVFAVLIAVFADDTVAYLAGRLVDGSLLITLGELATVPRAAIVVEDRWADVFRLEHVAPSVVAEMVAAAQVRYPTVPIMFCETRPLAQEWAYRFLGAALRFADEDAQELEFGPGDGSG